MKRWLILYMFIVLASVASAQEKTIVNPVYENGSTRFFTSKVILNSDRTTLGICYKLSSSVAGTWGLAAGTHLVSGGKKYAMKNCAVFSRDENSKVIKSEALDSKKSYSHEWDSLSIDFEPLDKDCVSFDLIEDQHSNFNHYGVRLDGKRYDYLFKDKAVYQYGMSDPLPPIVPQYGKSVVKYEILRHDGGNYEMGLFAVDNEFSGGYYPFDKNVQNQHVVEASSVLFCQTYDGCAVPTEPYGMNQFKQLLIPGTETTVTFDAAACLAMARSEGTAKIPFDKCVRFSGSIADLQEVLMRERDYGVINIKEHGIGADSLWALLQTRIKKIHSKEDKYKKYTRRQKEFLQLWLEYNYVKKFQIPELNPKSDLRDEHAKELGMLFKDGRSYYLIGNDVYLDYALANGIKSEVTEWMEGYRCAKNLAGRICNLELMPEEAFDTIPELFHKQLHELNDSTAATIKRLSSSTGKVVVKDTPDVVPADFLKMIIEENEGCVVFVDFWATWCGPCKKGINAMEQKKDEFIGKPVKFIYVTNESSPANEWSNAIQSMPGIHYRLKNGIWSQINEIRDAIPRYMMFDKKGKLIFEQTGYDDEVLEKIISHLRESLQ